MATLPETASSGGRQIQGGGERTQLTNEYHQFRTKNVANSQILGSSLAMIDAVKKTSKKPRVTVPKGISDAVFSEFSHKCAVCGRSRPQLHHIDEDPSNSVAENLLPLCPNHHLLDVHDPTRKPDSLKIRLFRRTRDPFVLDPKFEPIWKRLKFVWQPQQERVFDFDFHVKDLCKFIHSFKMGDYYAARLQSQFVSSSAFFERERKAAGEKYKVDADFSEEDLQAARIKHQAESVENLCVEMIRYQDWPLANALTNSD